MSNAENATSLTKTPIASAPPSSAVDPVATPTAARAKAAAASPLGNAQFLWHCEAGVAADVLLQHGVHEEAGPEHEREQDEQEARRAEAPEHGTPGRPVGHDEQQCARDGDPARDRHCPAHQQHEAMAIEQKSALGVVHQARELEIEPGNGDEDRPDRRRHSDRRPQEPSHREHS